MKKILTIALIVGLTGFYVQAKADPINWDEIGGNAACTSAKAALKEGCKVAIRKIKDNHKDRVRGFKEVKGACIQTAKQTRDSTVSTIEGNSSLSPAEKKTQKEAARSKYKEIDAPKCKEDFKSAKDNSKMQMQNAAGVVKNGACVTLKQAAATACKKQPKNN